MSYAAQLTILSILNWFHLVATVAWIGGVFTNLLVIMPSARASLEPPVMGRFMGAFMGRFRNLVYISMGVMVVSGIFMMFFNKHFVGTFGNFWEQMLLTKHILVIALIIVGVYMLQVLVPKIGQLAAKGPSPELGKLQKRQARLGMTGFLLGLLILLFTGINGAISALP